MDFLFLTLSLVRAAGDYRDITQLLGQTGCLVDKYVFIYKQ